MGKNLVVEDDPQVRDTMRDILEFFGHEAVETSNGKEALDMLTDEVTLVMTDVNMPVMDGLELIRQLKTARPELPMIAMSGRPEHREDAMAAGAAVFISKPLKIKEILAAVAEALAP